MKFFETKDVMTKVSKEVINTADFIKLEPVEMQREHKLRAKRLAKQLNSTSHFIPTGLEVAIAEYPNGTRKVLNGNTRAWVWTHYDDFGVVAPDKLYATVHHVKDKKETERVYLTYDSSEAVENNKHRIQGHFRELGIQLTDPTLMAGTMGKALEAMTAYYETEEGVPLKGNNKLAISEFSEAILALDRIGVSRSFLAKQSVIAACLMMLHKYGAHNKKVLDMISDLKNTKGISNGDVCDGIHFIKYELQDKKYLGDTFAKTDAKSLPENMNYILYCLDKQLHGLMFNKIGSKVHSFYSEFWED